MHTVYVFTMRTEQPARTRTRLNVFAVIHWHWIRLRSIYHVTNLINCINIIGVKYIPVRNYGRQQHH